MKLTRRGFLKFGGAAAVGTAVTAVAGYTYATHIEPERLVVESVHVPIKGLHSALDGFVIVQLCDFHLHPYTPLALVNDAVSMANSLQPDILFLTGDYVLETADAIFELAPVLATLNARHGLFTVLGNHDHWTDASIVRTGLRESRLTVLHNEGLSLNVGKARLSIAGLDDSWSGQPDVAAALTTLPADTPIVLLAHEPDFADAYLADGRVTLQLSGHSHGGQVRLPDNRPLKLPRYGQKYHNGLYPVHQGWVYTSRGIGVVGPPVRVNCPPEISKITLVRA